MGDRTPVEKDSDQRPSARIENRIFAPLFEQAIGRQESPRSEKRQRDSVPRRQHQHERDLRTESTAVHNIRSGTQAVQAAGTASSSSFITATFEIDIAIAGESSSK